MSIRIFVGVAAVLASIVGTAVAQDAPYVDSKITRDRFSEVTAEDMDLIRSKKILLASRSFGLNLHNGFRQLGLADKKFDMLTGYARFDLFRAGGNLDAVPADAFKNNRFVHVLVTHWPLTKRLEEVDAMLRGDPHQFAKQADIVIVFYHTARPELFEQYAATMDKWVKDFPDIRFIHVTAGFQAPEKAKENEPAHAWSEKVRERYKGKQPLYDLGKILSDDFRGGHAYVPEYSRDPAGVHPSAPEGQDAMAKGMLLLLRDTLRWKPAVPDATPSPTPAAAPAAVAPAAVAPGKAEVLPADHPDRHAVQAILNANGLTQKKVDNVAVVEQGRVVKLYLQEGGMTSIPDDIGVLTELRLLHCYGDRTLKQPLLTRISPAIGKCTKLEELLLNQNDLPTLPAEIVSLQKLTALSIADNKLKELPPAVQSWAAQFDPKGLALQNP